MRSKPRLKYPNEACSSRRASVRCLPSDGSCGCRSSEQSAGLNVSETKQEITVEAAIVTANWRKNWPEMPERKADGTNTAHSTSAMETSAPPTSSIVRWAASFGVMPTAMLRSTFSTTTIASSTTMPTASTSPNNDRLFSDIPNAYKMMRVLTSETGIAITGISEARHVCRNRNTTPTTSRIATNIVVTTSCTDFATKIVGS